MANWRQPKYLSSLGWINCDFVYTGIKCRQEDVRVNATHYNTI